MSFKRIEVNKFAGFNSSVAPELLDDGMARDIMNFRMEKIGKLVTRNGYTFGLFSSGTGDSTTHKYSRPSQPFASFINNNGIVGIGEMVFSSKWKEIDTDRVMVYAIRCEFAPSGEDWVMDKNEHLVNYLDVTGRKYSLMGYLFSPMSGKYKNQLLFNWQLLGQTNESTLAGAADDVFHTSIDARPQSKLRDNNGTMEYESSRRLFAPHRFLEPGTLTKDAGKLLVGRFDMWINYYVDMTQYRHQLIVSDKINGDTLIEDEANRGLNTSDTTAKKHSLHIRPNCLDEFDIDDVIIDLRNRTDQENDAPENGMALYKFKLPKMTQMTSTNLCDGSFSNLDNYGSDYCHDRASQLFAKSKAVLKGKQVLYIKEGDPDYMDCVLEVNNTDVQVFTNADNNSEVDNILGALEYEEQEYTNDEGEVVKDLISDVYIWEDYRIPYYLCSGKEQGFTFYRELDRIFTKTTNAPRIQELTVKDENGKRVPLGVWRYRFVWDYGEGVYSAPSAELTVPDLLWSAVPDTEFTQGMTNHYARYVKYADEDYTKSYVDDSSLHLYTPFNEILYPAITSNVLGQMSLTAFGKRVFDLKLKMYDKVQHRFGVKTATGYEASGFVIDSLRVWDELDYADASTLIVLNAGAVIQTKGIFAEFGLFAGNGVFQNENYNDGKTLQTDTYLTQWKIDDSNTISIGPTLDKESQYALTSMHYIAVPILPGVHRLTKYSLCDPEGRLRLSYRNVPKTTGDTLAICMSIMGQVVAPGVLWGTQRIFTTGSTGPRFSVNELVLANANVYSDKVFNADSVLYYNIIPYQELGINPGQGPSESPMATIEGYDDVTLDYDKYKDLRPDALLRVSVDSRDSLVRTAQMDTAATSRLILSGIAEIKVSEAGDTYGVESDFRSSSDSSESREWYYSIPNDCIANKALHYRLPFYTNTNYIYDKLDIRLYIPATRFIGVEQLTSYFPSSLLFGAPRLGIKINAADVPTRAKRLLVYRTIATHNNDWDPMSFGLVEKITIDRDATGQAQTLDKDGNPEYQGIYFFDDVKDKALDFTDNPNSYDGLRRALFSRFNISINERVYYANFTEVYQSLAPRGAKLRAVADTNTALITNFAVFNDADKGFDANETYDYCYVYENEADQLSKPKYIDNVVVAPDVANGKKSVVVLYWLPSKYDDTIKELKIYRKDVASGKYHYIGSSKPEDEGIFVDDNKRLGALLGSINPDVQHYEDGVRWSEPFQPDWIKLNSFAEYRSGDNKGARITGLESLEGNLVVFKENSIHRVAVQAEDPPLSRTDEVSQEVGCIAPNTLINVNGVLYFLSNRGFMSYDNNRLMSADGAFGEELQYIIQNLHDMDESGRNIPDTRLYADYLREASCGYNQYYNEIYLNIPQIPAKLFESELIAGKNLVPGLHIADKSKVYTDFQRKEYYGDKLIKETPAGQEVYEEHMRDILGHIYVINPEKQYVTKFAYQGTLNLGDSEQWDIRMIDGLQNVRLYYSNSLGEMRSADIVPKQHGYPMTDTAGDANKINWAGMYIETPYLSLKPRTHIVYDTTTQVYSGYTIDQDDTHSDHDQVFDAAANKSIVNTGLATGAKFPKYKWAPIEAEWRSKFFTGDSETLLKRVRSVVMNVFSKGGIQARGLSFHREGYDDRIEYDSPELSIAVQTFQYSPTNTNVDYNTGVVTVGTNDNVLSFVPRSPYDGQLDEYDDRYGKPIRFAVDIRTNRRAQINSVVLHWRPIHTYLR